MRLRLGISPCPNDTFIFEALLHNRVDCGGLNFDVRFADVQELNEAAARREFDVVKTSFFAYTQLRDHYQLLNAGAALGRGVGPLIVARKALDVKELPKKIIAVPGLDTTAYLLLRFFAPEANTLVVRRFDEIMPAVQRGEVDAGVIIHESRFTYAEHGLVSLQDLGDYWEAQTGLPIPLGGILAKQSLGEEVIQTIETALRSSVEFAFANRGLVQPFIAEHAQEMASEVQQKHIALYVTPFSVDLGPEGHAAVERLLAVAENLPAHA